jgi:asparagine synthase (glutamine-hydrolysing)
MKFTLIKGKSGPGGILMCGLAGLFYSSNFSGSTKHLVENMVDSIIHRGPDDTGVWMDGAAGIALAHRRLSILDLSPAGHQPMESESGRFVIVFNGEIYNHQELRLLIHQKKEQPAVWRGHSDTETLLACIEAWGFESTLKVTVGMFAIALWDRETCSLFLARDRMGEKPLYYGWVKKTFIFGSELKALKTFPGFDNGIDRKALTLMMRHNYIAAPYSIYKDIKKLSSGTYLKIQKSNLDGRNIDKPISYWSLNDVVETGTNQLFRGTDAEAVTFLDQVLQRAVGRQMLADVPLGAFLSGGIDSSTIVALMQAQSTHPVKTFSIGFHVKGYNEAQHAKKVAQYLGTDHTELYISPEEAMKVIPHLPTIYDEPFSDASQIPTLLVAKMARKYVTVSLSGDAGDELFGGYNRYFGTHRWWKMVNAIPLFCRSAASASLLSIPTSSWDILGKLLTLLAFDRYSPEGLGNKIQKLAGVLTVKDCSSLYKHFVSHWSDPEELVINGTEPPTQITQPKMELENIVEQMMLLDSLTYLPDDILCKVDRAAMVVSLETRVPFLDHQVVEFAWRLPLSMKVRNGQGKWLLRQVLYQYVPKKFFERPKMGFAVPIDQWLRGPLRDWAEALLDRSRLRQEGFFNPVLIQKKWVEHLSGKCNWQYHLWNVLMFQAWLEKEREVLDNKMLAA